ncbi:MAG: CvpA family protein [Planctomycetales bacterium]|nr:CvpA family protein [Planctomycetales bacterium]
MDYPIIDIVLCLTIVGVTWCVAGEGAWGAGLTCLCVLFAGVLAMNFFEPVANWLGGVSLIGEMFADVIALTGLFAAFVFGLRWATDNLAPTSIDIDGRIYQVTRWGFALATGYLTVAILLTALHTTPLPRTFIGFSPERKNLLDMDAPDRWWLGFNQYLSESILWRNKIFDGPELAPLAGTPKMIWPSFTIRYATRRELHGRPGKKPGLVTVGPAGQGGGTSTPAAPASPGGGF